MPRRRPGADATSSRRDLLRSALGLPAARALLAAAPGRAAEETPARGPLRVHLDNPRYFTDGSGRAVYLTGSHTWNNLVDMGRGDPPGPFDFDAYLDFLRRHGHPRHPAARGLRAFPPYSRGSTIRTGPALRGDRPSS